VEKTRRDALLGVFLGAAAAAAAQTTTSLQPNPSATGEAKPEGRKVDDNTLSKEAEQRSKALSESIDSSFPVKPSATALYQRDEATWKRIQERVSELYGVNTDATKLLNFATQAIESTFLFKSIHGDETFRFQNAEVLLDQCADVLERALAQRSEYYGTDGKEL
jgi:hypothetical protein